MQKRHLDRQQYFRELANTSREFYLDYLRPFVHLAKGTRLLEIGCGEGGNLLPFAEAGCQVTGIDLSEGRIRQARCFFDEAGQTGTFICQDFLLTEAPQTESLRYDLVLIHDVIEHIAPEMKELFITHIRGFLKHRGLIFIGFPPWQMPFGGHQQIVRGLVSKLPFVHLLPNILYRTIIKLCGNTETSADELLNIKRCKMSIERFEQLTAKTGYRIRQRTLWLINPHYQQKFHLTPRRLWSWAERLPYVRNFYSTSAFYLLE